MGIDAPLGWYLARDVGQLAGVSGDRIGQWARRGYIRSSISGGNPRVYSFQDVAEAMVVHELTERGVRHRDIRQAIRNLRDRFGDWPLTAAPLSTTASDRGQQAPPSARIVYRDKNEGLNLDIGRGTGEQAYLPDAGDLSEIVKQLRRGGWVIRQLPGIHAIEVDPNRLSGKPTIRGRRVPAEKVAELARTADGIRSLRDDYELSPDEIDDAISWYDAVCRYEEAA